MSGHACNPSTWEMKDQDFKVSLSYTKPYFKNNRKGKGKDAVFFIFKKKIMVTQY